MWLKGLWVWLYYKIRLSGTLAELRIDGPLGERETEPEEARMEALGAEDCSNVELTQRRAESEGERGQAGRYERLHTRTLV